MGDRRMHADAQWLMVLGCSRTIHQWSGNVQTSDLSWLSGCLIHADCPHLAMTTKQYTMISACGSVLRSRSALFIEHTLLQLFISVCCRKVIAAEVVTGMQSTIVWCDLFSFFCVAGKWECNKTFILLHVCWNVNRLAYLLFFCNFCTTRQDSSGI